MATRRKTAPAAAPATIATDGPPVLRDTRQLVLGFYDPSVPGIERVKRKEAKRLAKDFAEKLVEALVKGKPLDAQVPVRTGGVKNVTSRPQIMFRGERLVVPGKTAEYFSILDIRVGNRSQLVEATALPAQCFAENAVGVRLSLDVASIAQDVVLSVQNESRKDRPFRAMLIGTGTY